MRAELSLFRPREAIPDLETLLISPEWFGLTTASALQRAICRILDGLPLGDLATHPDVVGALGGEGAIAALPTVRPTEFLLLAGIRTGKSLLDALIGIRSSLTCDVSKLGPGEVPRVAIVSTKVKTARETWNHVSGRILASPRLRAMLVGDPKADSLRIRHPSGRPVEICVSAGSRAADNLIGCWLAAAIFDEAPRMVGAEDGVVNLDEARTAIAGRMLPGGQIVMSGSPWAPFGPVYKIVNEHHGKPTAQMVVVRGTGPQMNPGEWTPERCAELKARKPDAYEVDVLTNFLDPEAGIFTEPELKACAILDQCAPCERFHYSASMDPATRGNSWTLTVGALDDRGALRVELAHQWTGSSAAPLSPRVVFGEMAALLAAYRVTVVRSDEWAADALRDLASEHKLWLQYDSSIASETNECARRLRDRVTERTIELPADNMQLLRDLHTMRKVVTQTGHRIELPVTSDGRHCDYVPALLKLVGAPLAMPDPLPTAQGTVEKFAEDRAAEKEAARRAVEASNAKRSRLLLRNGAWGRPPTLR